MAAKEKAAADKAAAEQAMADKAKQDQDASQGRLAAKVALTKALKGKIAKKDAMGNEEKMLDAYTERPKEEPKEEPTVVEVIDQCEPESSSEESEEPNWEQKDENGLIEEESEKVVKLVESVSLRPTTSRGVSSGPRGADKATGMLKCSYPRSFMMGLKK